MSEYLILLIELHNTFTLFIEARKQQKENPSENGKKWINEIFREMTLINGKLLNYTDEFIELSEKIESAAVAPQLIVIDRFMSTGYFSEIYHRLGCLKRQKFQLLEMFQQSLPDLKELIKQETNTPENGK
jgi:hypothetical protein